jgi:twitching motility protein PilT
VIAESGYDGMQTFDQSLLELVRSGVVSEQDARVVATNPHDFALALGRAAIEPTPAPDELVVQGAVTDE